ncbi:hypothetical protein DEO23_15600 [Brachybacterium endophyticum]|uniref:Uncharacterized protein n=2 Tax=Brachybacterium endophyticum TaxID=2182385 RepID=A0A2U2RGG9_9MICO|nr:hypothetical protein DEO23_15600 [Brachybacterium endophyticum]
MRSFVMPDTLIIYPLIETTRSASAFTAMKQWIHEHEIALLEVTTARDGHSLTTVGDAEIFEGANRAPGQTEHVASRGDDRAIIIASPGLESLGRLDTASSVASVRSGHVKRY